MAKIGEARKAGDRRRVRANRVVDSTHTGRAAGSLMRVSRVGEFKAGFTTGKNGRA